MSPLVITAGEPAGIGPDLILQLAAEGHEVARPWLAVGDPALFRQRAARLGLAVEVVSLADGETPVMAPGRLSVWPVALRSACQPGRLATANADYVLESLDLAIAACREGRASAMVTAPLHKGVIIEAGHAGFTGHTEYLRDACGVDDVVMMLATDDALHARSPSWQGSPGLRVALATTHLPLREVADAITPASLGRVLRILDHDLRHDFGIARPRIAVCGLNPHAGEDGHLGREELEVIAPTLDALRGEGLILDGPLPADTLFTPRHLADVDAVLAMYHDQGLAVLKYAGFGRGANLTLGLPIVRTSVDHGTALDLAASGRADAGSLAVALNLAAEMAAARAASA
ncbi:4-hydroxythreonine-4-phosphate dehydrogenase [Franzmannia pantelleriensis]|uniref:4-hydroxythreonine-4-phosphate dehydrogenase n=1 Tax=Franzmannia pantelleriensis TaxID=48727 RepID=A0A1G9PTG4_9GAMM|nr:4-hydroxythreonine-4-phosphate dehydrogenase PdxA [Halomonas pantelleriensis]SDM02082.1 4-hydroxythreonine-4-phosphate dehydrogenase [Halomonas pantelleriensis]